MSFLEPYQRIEMATKNGWVKGVVAGCVTDDRNVEVAVARMNFGGKDHRDPWVIISQRAWLVGTFRDQR